MRKRFKWERATRERLGWRAQEAKSRECRDGVGQRVAEHVRLGAPASAPKSSRLVGPPPPLIMDDRHFGVLFLLAPNNKRNRAYSSSRSTQASIRPGSAPVKRLPPIYLWSHRGACVRWSGVAAP